MKILALEVDAPDATAEQFTLHLKAEARRAWELHQQGIIREIYLSQDQRRVAVLMLECASVEEAEAALATLPLVREGLIRFDLIPLAAYPGFARLFAQD